MNKYLMILAASVIGSSAMAQDTYDAANFAGSDLNGTARYVGMGGALSALGGDVTTMSTNPAGTAVFRRGEAAISGSLLFTSESGQLGHDGTRGSLDQGGVLFTLDQENKGNAGLQYINFGINYVKKRNHLSNLSTGIENLDGIFSQTYQIADLANSAYDNDSWGYLADMSAPAYDESGALSKDGIVIDYYDDNGNFTGYGGVGANSALYRRSTYGSTTQADFNLSFNVSDKYFFGLSIGVYNIDYNREAFYTETGSDGHFYDFTNWYQTNGDGFDVKLGFIWRPFDNSPFRIGLTVHTPTWYNMEDQNGSVLYYENSYVDTRSTDPFEYHYRTPWKFGLSLGHTVGNYFAIGAEYEMTDMSTCHYSTRDDDWSNDQYFDYINDITKHSLKVQHTFKVGMEVKPIDNFSIRCGYNYVSSPFKDSAYRTIAYDSPFTETDFTNWKAINRITFGLGYRYKGGYFDIAYQYQAQKGDFYAFDDVDLKPTEIDNNRSQLIATLGFRF